jgi:ATP-dependent protease ClpP protease subunit
VTSAAAIKLVPDSDRIIRLVLKGWIGRSEDRLQPEIHALDVERALALDRYAPAVISLETGGGFLAEAFRVHEIIQEHRGHVTAIVRMNCDSAGPIVLLAADRRVCTPWASFRLHRPRFWQCDFPGEHTARTLRDLAFELDEFEARMIALLSERTNERGSYWRARVETLEPGWAMVPNEALESGLVHEVTR